MATGEPPNCRTCLNNCLNCIKAKSTTTLAEEIERLQAENAWLKKAVELEKSKRKKAEKRYDTLTRTL